MDILRNLDVFEIQQYQQNRYPVLFVDRIEEAKPGVEVLTQVFLMSFLTLPEYKGKKTAFLGVNNFHFRKKIIPGDRLEVEAIVSSCKRGICKGSVVGKVEGEVACEGELIVSIPDILRSYLPKI